MPAIRSSLHEQGAEVLKVGGIEPHDLKDQASISVDPAQLVFWKQIEFCEFEILPGPQKTVRWGVPDGTRDPMDGNLVHDDLLISAAMVSILDSQDWTVSGPTLIIKSKDPLNDLDKGF